MSAGKITVELTIAQARAIHRLVVESRRAGVRLPQPAGNALARAHRAIVERLGGLMVAEPYEPSCYRCQMGDPHSVHQTASEYYEGVQ